MHGQRGDVTLRGMAGAPLNDDADDVSDAEIYLRMWTKALRLQENRLRTGDGKLDVDTRFAIFAASNVVTCCRMFVRHNVPHVQEFLDEYSSRQPVARSLRNALEHLDDYLRGQGAASKGQPNWFPLGGERDADGRVHLAIPRLGDVEGHRFDVTQLIHDILWLSMQVQDAVSNDQERRMRKYFGLS